MATKLKKRPSSDQVNLMLSEGNFGQSIDDPLPLTDPVSTTQVVLKLKDIKPYDKNPRREKNPAYEEIKASIRSKKQLNNNFNVTRRPGDDLFMVESGGNTRLAILKELYLETADEDYNMVHCLFVPWKSESSILTAHLIENEMRGDMMLIDKAYAVQELKWEIEEEQGEKLSDKKFTQLATIIGYKISRTHLIRFKYALKLDQMIPLILRTGIGGHKIDHIKKVEKAYQQYCLDKAKTTKELFDAAFMAVLSESDSDESWDFDRTRLELDDRLSELTGIRYNLLRLEVDAILFNQPINDTDPFDQNEQPDIANQENTQSESGLSTTISAHTHSNESEIKLEEQGERISNTLDDSAFPPEEKNAESTVSNYTEMIRPEPTEKELPTQIKILRQKGYDLAHKIAKSAGNEELVIPAIYGMGFLIESPGQPLAPDSTCYYNWWLLFGISEQNVRNESHYSMWAFTDLYNRFGEEQRCKDNSLENWIGPDPGVMHLMYEYLHKQELINDQVFTHVFRLMENCRKIRGKFLQNEIWDE